MSSRGGSVEKQIPFGNDNQKGKSNGKDSRVFHPSEYKTFAGDPGLTRDTTTLPLRVEGGAPGVGYLRAEGRAEARPFQS